MGKKDTLEIEIKVNDKGTAVIKKLGKTVEKTGKDGKKSFKKIETGLDDVKKKTASATKMIAGMAGAVVGITAVYTGFRTLNSVLSESISLSNIQEEAENNLAAVLRATGEAAGYNLAQLKDMASGMQNVTTAGDEVIMSGMSILATFKQVRGEGFERATMAALDMSKVMKQDLNSSILQIGKALNDPILGITALNRAGVQFTQDQKAMVKQLQLSGDMVGAQEIILEELESQFGGVAIAARETFGGAMEAAGNALGDVKEQIGDVITKNEKLNTAVGFAEDIFNQWVGELKDANSEGGELRPLMDDLAESFTTIGENVKDNVVPALIKALGLIGKIAKYAGLRSITNTAKEAAELSKKGAFTMKEFSEATFLARQEMVDAAKEQLKYAGITFHSITKATEAYKKEHDALDETARLVKLLIAQKKELADAEVAAFEMGNTEGLQEFIDNLERLEKFDLGENYDSKELDEFFYGFEDHLKKLNKEEKETTKKTAKAYKQMYAGISRSGKEDYEIRKKLLEKERDEQIELTGDRITAEKSFHDQRFELWKNSETISANIFNSITDNFKYAVDSMVDAFIAGEDMKQSVAEVTKSMLVNMAGDISKKMFDKAIDGIIDLIAAHIGQGAAASGGAGATKGGAVGALAEIGVFLGTGVAAMLAGRAAANQFRAEGGWIGRNQNGGWINEGSHSKDDVFLGSTPGVRHWGMGGEFVVNQKSSKKHAALLESINRDYADGGPVIPWESTADALAIGSGMSFVHGTYKGGGFATGLAEMLAYIVKVIPGMFLGKYMADEFRADGGWINSDHGFGGFLPGVSGLPTGVGTILDPITNFIENITPHGLQGLIPLNPADFLDELSEYGKDFLLDLIRAPLEQVARDLVTPGVYHSSPLKGIERTLKNIGDMPFMPSLDAGIDYVPADMPAFIHQGEAVLTKEENQARKSAMHVHVYLDGKEISYAVTEQIEDGNIELIESIRGVN